MSQYRNGLARKVEVDRFQLFPSPATLSTLLKKIPFSLLARLPSAVALLGRLLSSGSAEFTAPRQGAPKSSQPNPPLTRMHCLFSSSGKFSKRCKRSDYPCNDKREVVMCMPPFSRHAPWLESTSLRSIGSPSCDDSHSTHRQPEWL